MTQTPDMCVVEGETVNITCCWTMESTRISVNWLKNNTSIKKETIQKNPNTGFLQKNCSHLTIMNIAKEDSGRYTCKVIVEIPGLLVLEGNGTTITVTAAKRNTTGN